MAHKTRKKLTKKEIQHDPVGEKLEAGLLFIQRHIREVIGGLIAIVVILLVGQYIISRRNSAAEESMAGFITASQIFNQSMSAASMNQLEQAFQGMDASYSLAMQTWNGNPQNEWARKSAVLGAKIDIIRGNYDGALTTLTTLLSANPGDAVKVPALLHMGLVLENRGSEQDLINAESSYQELLTIAGTEDVVMAQAYLGLSRISYSRGEYQESSNYLNQALAFHQDTTAFESYRLQELAELTR